MKKIEKLKNSSFSRGLFAARTGLRMLPSILSGDEDPRKLFQQLIGSKIEQFVNDVGELKGSVLKAAQILSLYGEYYLPPEVNEVLKKVQSQSHYLGWDKITTLIPDSFHQQLIIDQNPIAAASIGQVHRARIKKTGEEIVLKIQYPGIKKAIDLDIKMIKSFLSLGKFMPQKMNMDGIYGEIKRVLIEEMDYVAEKRKHDEYKALLANVPKVYIPKVYPEFCNETIIASEFIAGTPFSDLDLSQLSESERNRLGETFFTLFFKEVFHGSLIQTDSHPGNFIYRDSEIVLIDFGACLHFPTEDLNTYRKLIKTVYLGERKEFFETLTSLNSRLQLDEDLLWKYCLLAASPLHSEDYDWGSTQLPDEISPLAAQLIKTSQIETPPHQFIFLDRKLLGLFSMLRRLGSRFNVKKSVAAFLE